MSKESPWKAGTQHDATQQATLQNFMCEVVDLAQKYKLQGGDVAFVLSQLLTATMLMGGCGPNAFDTILRFMALEFRKMHKQHEQDKKDGD